MAAYYNEIDPYAAAWVRRLIAAGHIADGVVDERSIEDIHPAELREFTQCHFFAGIGVWSRALRAAGWPDERRAWTGSCPCQPFSSAGKGAGFADERHLWPAFHHLISECRPPVVFGEQVASKDGLNWLDLVRTDLEATGYAVGASDLCAAGIGAPHIRQRLWWVADADTRGGKGRDELREPSDDLNGSGTRRLADADGRGQRERSQCNSDAPQPGQQAPLRDNAGGRIAHGGLDNNNNTGLEGQRGGHCTEVGRHGAVRPVGEAGESGGVEYGAGSRPTHSFWGDADWLFCRDGKWRPVEPGTFPLVDGAPARVGRLRAYGNAIVPQVAETFIRAYLDIRG